MGQPFEEDRAPFGPIAASELLPGRARCYVGQGPRHPGGPEHTEVSRFANGCSIVVHYSDAALRESELKKSIGLELVTDNTAQLERKIQAFGIQPFDYFDKDHFYLQAPGGQVLRVAGT